MIWDGLSVRCTVCQRSTTLNYEVLDAGGVRCPTCGRVLVRQHEAGAGLRVSDGVRISDDRHDKTKMTTRQHEE
jgi:ribosomal protein S27E